MEKEQNFIQLDSLLVEVKIVNRRERFGFRQFQIIPVAGSGEKWVNAESLLKPAKDKVIKKN